MVIICWAAKGGSGTTVLASALALRDRGPTLLVDLDGEVPRVLGLAEPDRPGVSEWAASDAPASHLDDLLIPIRDGRSLLPWRVGGPTEHALRDVDRGRLRDLGEWLRRRGQPCDAGGRAGGSRVIVDAGTGEPPPQLLAAADQVLLVTRRCYLALGRTRRVESRITGVVVVDEPWRGLSSRDVEASVGAPVVATVDLDPAVARAVDAGLLMQRLPSGYSRRLEAAVR